MLEARKTDIFSFGMVFWDIWADGDVFRGNKSELENEKQNENILEIAKKSIEDQNELSKLQKKVIEQVLAKCLQFRPQDRVSSLIELIPLLQRLADTLNSEQDNFTHVNQCFWDGTNEL